MEVKKKYIVQLTKVPHFFGLTIFANLPNAPKNNIASPQSGPLLHHSYTIDYVLLQSMNPRIFRNVVCNLLYALNLFAHD
jgi:hypothetical protein